MSDNIKIESGQVRNFFHTRKVEFFEKGKDGNRYIVSINGKDHLVTWKFGDLVEIKSQPLTDYVLRNAQ
jgi:hypothetical protein